VSRGSTKLKEENEPEPAPAEPGGRLGSIVRGAPLKPIRFVERELTRPDGTTLRVKVPVYPPFRLEERSTPPPAPDSRKRELARRKAG
jgi:hypothetical protein